MDTEPQNSTDGAPDPSSPVSSTIDVTARREHSRTSGTARGLLVALAIGLVAVFAMQVFTLVSASRTDEQIAALDDQISSVDGQIISVVGDVAAVQESVDAVDQKVDDLATGSLISPTASGASAAAAPSTPEGYLPPFEQGQPDAALGVVLGEVAGVEYYTETEMTIDPADGTARAWLVWAHWCPHCQRELPPLSEWYTENADAYSNVELVSISSSIDPTRGNPLEPYLDDLQLPFPTILDPDLALAEQFGLSAYPFWVFTGGDGTTLLRVAGYVEIEQIAEIFDQLEALSA
ncbi:MAG: TlpA disulfide reductase family protein [Actinomycetota bacterium]|nr:TlpA disulfide reductase family protein [Actinomycetota bacterium]